MARLWQASANFEDFAVAKAGVALVLAWFDTFVVAVVQFVVVAAAVVVVGLAEVAVVVVAASVAAVTIDLV